MSIKLDLAKRVVLNLAKDAGIGGQKAKVVVCMDYSGSMGPLYSSGFVEQVIERLIPIAMAFDDDQEIEFYIFHQGVLRILPNVTVENVVGYVQKYIMQHKMGYTNYAPAINQIISDFKADSNNITSIGNTFVEPKTGFFNKLFGNAGGGSISGGTKAKIPAFVMFITDGDNGDKDETTRTMIQAANHGLFFQFIGIKSRYSEAFNYLRKLDTMSGRVVDNANFFEITDEDMRTSNDAEFYSKLLNEFPSYVQEARKLGIIE